ncbi:hypothetical protein CLOP_g5135 [Closterium sp. NIES-67]|nr:hypothetical protein CLOP_g5135 [Closterium sp. NIES-67]
MQGPPSSGKASPMGSRPLTGGLLNNLQPRLLPSSRSLQQVTDTHGTDQQQQPMRLQSSEPQQQQSKLQQEAQQKQNKLHANSGIQGDSRPLQPTEDLQQLQQKQQHQQCATANAHQPSLDHCHSYHYQQQQHQQSSYHQQQVQQRQPNPSTSQRSPQAELQDVVNTVPLLVNAAPACDSTSPHPTRAFSHMDCPVGMKKSESVCDSSATSVSRAPAPLPRASTAPTASHTANLDHYTSSMLLQQSSIFQGETDPCSEQHLSAPPGNFTNALPFGHGGILTNDHLTTGLDYMASPVDDMDGATWTDAGLATVQELELQELEVLEWLPDNDIGASGFFDHIDHGLDQAGLEGAITLANDDNGEQDVDEEEAAELEPQQFANSAAVSTDGTLHPVKLPEAGQDGAAFEPETKGAEMEGPAVEIAGWTAQGMPVIVEGETMGRGNGMSGSVNPGSASEAAAVVEDGDQGVLVEVPQSRRRWHASSALKTCSCGVLWSTDSVKLTSVT